MSKKSEGKESPKRTNVKKKSTKKIIKNKANEPSHKKISKVSDEPVKPTIEQQVEPLATPQSPEPSPPNFSSNSKNPMKINPLFVIIGVSGVAIVIGIGLFLVMSENVEQQKLLEEQEKIKIQQQKELEIKQIELEAQEIARKQQELELQAKELEKKQQQIQIEKQQSEILQQEMLSLQQQEELERKQQEIQEQEDLRYQQEREYEEKIRMEQEDAQRQQEYLEKERIIEEARTNPLLKGIIDGTIRFYIEPIPSYYQVSGINNAVNNIANSLESTAMYGVKFQRVYDPNYADIDISWIKNYGTHQAGVAIFKSVVQVALGNDKCWGIWQPFDTWTVQKIMWHEIGHTLGFNHSSDPNNIMYYATATKHAIDVEFTFQLESGYSRWFSFCTSGDVSWHAESSNDIDGFDAFAIPPDDPKGFTNSGGTVYLDTSGENCGKRNIISITRYCSVGNGAYLHFSNNEDHTIYITFEMYDENPSYSPNMSWDSNAFEYDNSYLYTVWDLFH